MHPGKYEGTIRALAITSGLSGNEVLVSVGLNGEIVVGTEKGVQGQMDSLAFSSIHARFAPGSSMLSIRSPDQDDLVRCDILEADISFNGFHLTSKGFNQSLTFKGAEITMLREVSLRIGADSKANAFIGLVADASTKGGHNG